MSKESRRARIEARAEEIAIALAEAGAPAHLTKGASFAPLLAAEQFLPAARLVASSDDRIRRNGKRIRKMTHTLASLSAPPPEPGTLAPSPGGSRQMPFDPAQWRTGLIPAVPAPARNGHGPHDPHGQ